MSEPSAPTPSTVTTTELAPPISPRAKEPMMFTAKVPAGNAAASKRLAAKTRSKVAATAHKPKPTAAIISSCLPSWRRRREPGSPPQRTNRNPLLRSSQAAFQRRQSENPSHAAGMPRANCKPSEPMPLAKLPLSMCSAAVKAIAEKVVRLPQNPTSPSISLGGKRKLPPTKPAAESSPAEIPVSSLSWRRVFAPLCQTATTPPSRALPKTLTINTPCGSTSSTPHRAKAPNSPPKATTVMNSTANQVAPVRRRRSLCLAIGFSLWGKVGREACGGGA